MSGLSTLIGVPMLIVSMASPALLSAQGRPAQLVQSAASSFATVEVHINQRQIRGGWYEENASLAGPSRLTISYGQPHARGRAIVGGLIPTDTVWRLGADMATTLHTDVDITLGSLALHRGDYTLFLLHAAGRWDLIVNAETGQWGTDYDAAKDVGRVALRVGSMKDNEDALTIYLVPDAPHPETGYGEPAGVLRIRWGTTELSVPWRVGR